MKRYYANLLGNWIDITEEGTVDDHQDPRVYFKERLGTEKDPLKDSYINVQFKGKSYRIHPSMIQIVTEE